MKRAKVMNRVVFCVFAMLCMVFPGISYAADNSQPNVLIIYYSHTGNTERIAHEVQKQTGGDLYRIETVKYYPLERPAMTEVPKQELESGELPELKGTLPDPSGYDLIIVGSPVWWYTVPTPVMSFFQQMDFQGKKVAPFCTYGGGAGEFFADFKTQAKNAQVMEGLTLWGSESRKPEKFEQPVSRWLSKLKRSL